MDKNPFTAKPPKEHYLARAAWIGSLASASTWASQAINIDAPAGGRSPLLWAISRGHKDVMNLLLRKGADIAQKTADGDNALACAVWSGNVHMVQLMLERGFNPAEKSMQGKSAIDWAMAGENADIIQLLRSRRIAETHDLAAKRQQVLNGHARPRKFGPGL